MGCLTLGSYSGLLHCTQIPYHLSYQGSPRLTKKVVFEQTGGGGESEPGIHLGEAHSQPGNHQSDTLMLGQPVWLWQKEGVGRLGDEVG